MAFRLGITGQSGFIGRRLYAAAKRDDRFLTVPFERNWFGCPEALEKFAANCDAVVHLAGVSRSDCPREMYDINLALVKELAAARPGRVLFGSTTHIDKDSLYHASKRDGAAYLFAVSGMTTLEVLMPNTFGPGGKIFYNSVVQTFAYLAAKGEVPEKVEDVLLKLIYVDDLAAALLELALSGGASRRETIDHTIEIRLPELWEILRKLSAGTPPKNRLEHQLSLTIADLR